MNLITKVPLSKSNNPIDFNSKILSLGSCFAVNMGEKLDYYKFQNTTNLFGIIFNPVSIEKLIWRAVQKEYFTDQDFFFYNDLWHCYEVHSELSHPDKTEYLNNLNALLDAMYSKLTIVSHCIITLGTSWVYRHVETNSIVANCHKVPQKQFKKEILSVETIVNSIQSSIDLIQKINPNVHFVFTVSPVRHLKDGFVENQLSKAHLITAIQQISSAKSQFLTYFPSYEIMMDELRDYRFYAEDMVHPSQVAIAYIWERFVATAISPESHSIMEEVETIQKGLAHRPFNPNTTSHLLFVDKLEKKIIQLQSKYNHITF